MGDHSLQNGVREERAAWLLDFGGFELDGEERNRRCSQIHQANVWRAFYRRPLIEDDAACGPGRVYYQHAVAGLDLGGNGAIHADHQRGIGSPDFGRERRTGGDPRDHPRRETPRRLREGLVGDAELVEQRDGAGQGGDAAGGSAGAVGFAAPDAERGERKGGGDQWMRPHLSKIIREWPRAQSASLDAPAGGL